MCEVGAWKNFDTLEKSLTLMELIELYDAAKDRQQRMMKTIAAAFGAEFDDEDDEAPKDAAPIDPNKQRYVSAKDEAGNVIPGMVAPAVVNSQQDAMMINSMLMGNMIGYEQHG